MLLPTGTAWIRPARVTFLLGLLGVLPMTILTPPFQVPDEQEHFHRAYQLSELQIIGSVRDGVAGGILPSSLIKLSEDFLGTRAIHAPKRPTTDQPLRQTWLKLDRPLDPDRREFVDFSSMVFSSPLSYLPQVFAIIGGRWAGAGPLTLFYLARLANAVVAVVLLSSAVRLMPIAPEAVMLVGLLPMALFEYASVSRDAAVIGTAFLFSAVALRAQLRGTWTVNEALIAAVSGLILCAEKFVYAPLLVLGLPAVLSSERARQTLLVHGAILTIALGGTAIWLRLASPTIVPLSWTNPSDQIIYIVAHPLTYCKLVVTTILHSSPYFYVSLIGILGWGTVRLPMFVYFIPAAALLLSVLTQPWSAPRLPTYAVGWNVLICASIVLLIVTADYLYFTGVGSESVGGLQGRYLIPLAPLAIATACSVPRLRRSQKVSQLAFLAVTATIAVETFAADLSIVWAYQIF
jgi:uncharacterized membrane protein